ncbi:MAG: MarR family transcriptional regulator [Acidobacteriaceae bacterium]
MAIAKGEYKPGKNDPKVWFESLESLAQLLSDQNRALRKLIDEKHPQSLSELAEQSGREKSSLSRTLRNMERYGLSRFEPGEKRQPAPKVNYSGVEFKVSLQG